MSSAAADTDNIDKLYKNYDILNDAKEKITEVRYIRRSNVYFVVLVWFVGVKFSFYGVTLMPAL